MFSIVKDFAVKINTGHFILFQFQDIPILYLYEEIFAGHWSIVICRQTLLDQTIRFNILDHLHV